MHSLCAWYACGKIPCYRKVAIVKKIIKKKEAAARYIFIPAILQDIQRLDCQLEQAHAR